MTGPGDMKGSREQEVSNISRSLKAIAKELDVPIIALSQLNRSVEMRSGSKRPQLSDLRESGAIEQDADMVIFIYRPERYGFLEDEEGKSLVGLAEIIVAKHRNGPVGDVILRFREEMAKFVEMDNMEIGSLPGESENIFTIGSRMNDETSSQRSGFDSENESNKNNEDPF
jgi:replicative DNA helicase